ncbi:MAG TPA: hypothetical protein PKD37_03170 [Oligoflexia bacterium]|nr:hypothetical protein [Oligoflexia bacterium]HMP26969.1 hypothetical protein [Oligoflexia bacterium]
MNKALPILVILIVVLGGWLFLMKNPSEKTSNNNTSVTNQQSVNNSKIDGSTNINRNIDKESAQIPNQGSIELDNEETEIQPAVAVFKNASDALSAIKKGAAGYDDVLIEQFTLPTADCQWCPSLYSSLKDLLADDSAKRDEKSYYAEILAVSGRVDNIKHLVEGIKNAKSPDTSDLYAEALELTVGKEDVVKYLGEELATSDDKLRESIVAALTNQNSRVAIETLYSDLEKRGDPEAYYSQGIGPGEIIPSEEAFPFYQAKLAKRDKLAVHAVRDLFNAGPEGVKIAFETLSNGRDPSADRKLIEQAIDHISPDEETEAFLQRYVTSSKNKELRAAAEKILADIKASSEEAEEAIEDNNQYQSNLEE